MSGSNAAPIIIKRKKIVKGGGHHGGAWKVAYADFVTAMMAFFMLMWLLNATTEKQRKGLADYFAPTVSISKISGGGSGSMQGNSVFAEDTLPQNGTGASSFQPVVQSANREDTESDGVQSKMDAEFADIEQIFRERVVESASGNALMAHIATRITEEGLVITMSDLPDAPLFTGEAEMTPVLDELLWLVSEMARLVENEIAIGTHVRRFPLVLEEDPAWRLSRARAAVVLDRLIDADLPDRQIRRVTAHGDRDADKRGETLARNNRVELVFLR
ncbi:flagellar motor protein MotB [Roseivivax sp. THAF40]|nr:flagellar motor protein MotB [Roseivivax sp. THAF40]